jgi:formate hydrogenlyase subunit 3/multisubunit Na+/H+ antiporter MnhD subunit
VFFEVLLIASYGLLLHGALDARADDGADHGPRGGPGGA